MFHPKNTDGAWWKIGHKTINVFFSYLCCQMMQTWSTCSKLDINPGWVGGIEINIVFMTVCRRVNWIRCESESIDEARAINIKDIFGQLNYIRSSGHFSLHHCRSLSMFLLLLTWLHHACWVSCRPCVMISRYSCHSDAKTPFVPSDFVNLKEKRSQRKCLSDSSFNPHIRNPGQEYINNSFLDLWKFNTETFVVSLFSFRRTSYYYLSADWKWRV